MRLNYNLRPLNKAIKRFAANPKKEANQAALLAQIDKFFDQQFNSIDGELSSLEIKRIEQALRESSLRDYSKKPGFTKQLSLLWRNLSQQDARYKAENFEDEEDVQYLLGMPSLVLRASLGVFIRFAKEMEKEVELEPVVKSRSRLSATLKISLGVLLVSAALALLLLAMLVAAPALISSMGLAGTAVGFGLAAIAAGHLAITVTALSASTAFLLALVAIVPFAAARSEMTMLGFVSNAFSRIFGRRVASKTAVSDENLTAIVAPPQRFITGMPSVDSGKTVVPISNVSSESVAQESSDSNDPPLSSRFT